MTTPNPYRVLFVDFLGGLAGGPCGVRRAGWLSAAWSAANICLCNHRVLL